MHYKDRVVGTNKRGVNFMEDSSSLLTRTANYDSVGAHEIFDCGAFLEKFRYRADVDSGVRDPFDAFTHPVVSSNWHGALDRNDVIAARNPCNLFRHRQHAS